MKSSFLLVAATLAVALSSRAQTTVPAPAGWTTKARSGGATTFVPPGLNPGEVYSVTVYDSVPLNGKSLDAFLRAFAGAVGTKPGQLETPLQIQTQEGRAVSGTGFYLGPNASKLGVAFIGVSLDGGATIQMSRTLFSDETLLARYQNVNGDLMRGLIQNARKPVPSDVPAELPDGMKVGGDIVPGVYVGTQTKSGSFGSRSSLRLRVYIYPNGEYRVCDENDEDFNLSGPVVGRVKYKPASGRLDIKEFFALSNDNLNPRKTYCFYGRGAGGKPVIFGRSSVGATTSNGFTMLTWQGAPTGRLSKNAEDAPAREAKARRDRIQTRVAPGKGVPDAQVAAIFQDSSFSPGMVIPGTPDGLGGKYPDVQLGNTLSNDTYLLLRDGTIYRGLKLAPDQFDASASRRKEPENWGLWNQENGVLMSFAGEPYSNVPGKKVRPATHQTRLNGRYTAQGTSISFSPANRFKRSPLSPRRDASAFYTISKAQKPGRGGDLSGTYSLSGHALTLRYDNGLVERMLFFSEDARHQAVWFEGSWIELDKTN